MLLKHSEATKKKLSDIGKTKVGKLNNFYGRKHSEETKKKIGDIHRRQIKFNCEYCKKESSDSPSHYKRKKNHFCSQSCHSIYRSKLPFYLQFVK